MSPSSRSVPDLHIITPHVAQLAARLGDAGFVVRERRAAGDVLDACLTRPAQPGSGAPPVTVTLSTAGDPVMAGVVLVDASAALARAQRLGQPVIAIAVATAADRADLELLRMVAAGGDLVETGGLDLAGAAEELLRAALGAAAGETTHAAAIRVAAERDEARLQLEEHVAAAAPATPPITVVEVDALDDGDGWAVLVRDLAGAWGTVEVNAERRREHASWDAVARVIAPSEVAWTVDEAGARDDLAALVGAEPDDCCVRDDSTDCDCSRCTAAEQQWEREQGWHAPDTAAGGELGGEG